MTEEHKSTEKDICTVSPSLFRNNPIQFTLWSLFIIVGIVLFVFVEIGFWQLIGITLAIFGGFSLFVWWLKEYNTTLTITNRRSVYRKGIFSKQNIEIFHRNVRNIETTQSFFERIFDVGSLSIASSGQDGYDIIVKGIRDPEGIKQKINQFVVEE